MIAVFILVSQPTFAQSAYIFGVGAASCQSYTSASKGLGLGGISLKGGGRKYVSENAVYDGWLLGFITSVNVQNAMSGRADLNIKTDDASVISWVRHWCADHAKSTVAEGALAYIAARTGRK